MRCVSPSFSRLVGELDGAGGELVALHFSDNFELPFFRAQAVVHRVEVATRDEHGLAIDFDCERATLGALDLIRASAATRGDRLLGGDGALYLGRAREEQSGKEEGSEGEELAHGGFSYVGGGRWRSDVNAVANLQRTAYSGPPKTLALGFFPLSAAFCESSHAPSSSLSPLLPLRRDRVRSERYP